MTFYEFIKYLHVTAITLSVSGFIIRVILKLNDSPSQKKYWFKKNTRDYREKTAKYCSQSCAKTGKNHPMFGKIGEKNGEEDNEKDNEKDPGKNH